MLQEFASANPDRILQVKQRILRLNKSTGRTDVLAEFHALSGIPEEVVPVALSPQVKAAFSTVTSHASQKPLPACPIMLAWLRNCSGAALQHAEDASRVHTGFRNSEKIG